VEGGAFYKAFLREQEADDSLVKRVSAAYSQQIAQTAVRALEDRVQIGTLERQMEGYLRQLFEKERMKPDSMDAVIDYLLSVEEESADVRLIMAGKRNKLSPEDIQARLRRGYGR
jgi:vacuolar-type H+-ATPase subunit C/Vma6